MLDDIVALKVLEAWRLAAEALTRAGVRHVLAGDLAVGANGYPHATTVVEFLVGDEAFNHHAGGLVTMNAALPISVNGVAIDYLSPREGEAHLGAALAEPPGTILDAPRLVYMKLRAGRMRDLVDVAELIKRGLDAAACRAYVAANAAELLASFDDVATRAAAED